MSIPFSSIIVCGSIHPIQYYVIHMSIIKSSTVFSRAKHLMGHFERFFEVAETFLTRSQSATKQLKEKSANYKLALLSHPASQQRVHVHTSMSMSMSASMLVSVSVLINMGMDKDTEMDLDMDKEL